MPHPFPTPRQAPWRLLTLSAALFAAATAPGLLMAAETVSGPGPAADPLDATAAVAPLHYRSAFSSYRPLGQTTVRDWKEVNQEVNRLGGWRAYAREAQQALRPVEPGPSAATSAAPATPVAEPSARQGGAGHHHQERP